MILKKTEKFQSEHKRITKIIICKLKNIYMHIKLTIINLNKKLKLKLNQTFIIFIIMITIIVIMVTVIIYSFKISQYIQTFTLPLSSDFKTAYIPVLHSFTPSTHYLSKTQ